MRRALLVLILLTLSAPASVWAFCGFYVAGGDAKLFNEATQVVLMRHGTKTVLSMQNNYEGPADNFAMVIPVPQVLQEENVKTLPKEVFDRVDMMSAPRLVEYWEQDPCYRPPKHKYKRGRRKKSMAAPSMAESAKPAVRIEAQFQIAEYDVVVLSADESTALDRWLKQENYNIPDGAEPYLRPYVESGQYFFVAKVDVKKVKYENGRAVLSPLRFAYDSEKFTLPVRLGMINSKGQQDLVTYILAQNQRYEVANFDNVFIPTNIEVRDEVREEFGAFYRTLFDRTAEENPGAVVTEYSWAASSCDPCPGPTLNQSDFDLLGADEMKDVNAWGFTLTRLHARYTADQVGEDLVFVAAPPMVGGREVRDQDGALERDAKAAGQNNFQGRYIIRHEWAGEAKCSNPTYGVWGGPPGMGHSPKVGANPSPNTEGAGGPAKKASGRKLPDYLKYDIVIPKASPAVAPAVVQPSNPAPTQTRQQKRNRCSVALVGPAGGSAALLVLLGALIRRRRRD